MGIRNNSCSSVNINAVVYSKLCLLLHSILFYLVVVCMLSDSCSLLYECEIQ